MRGAELIAMRTYLLVFYCSWDDWVPQERLRKYSEENQELARNLKKEMERVNQLLRPQKPAASSKRKGGASGRGSEERNSTPAALAGKKRGRELDIEKVRHEL